MEVKVKLAVKFEFTGLTRYLINNKSKLKSTKSSIKIIILTMHEHVIIYPFFVRTLNKTSSKILSR